MALVKWSPKGTVESPSKASFAPVFQNKNIALGWISVKINIVLIKMLQEVGFFLKQIHTSFPEGDLPALCSSLPTLPARGSGTPAPFYPGQRDPRARPNPGSLWIRAVRWVPESPAAGAPHYTGRGEAASEPLGKAPGTGADCSRGDLGC